MDNRRRPHVKRIALTVVGLALVGFLALVAGFSVAEHRAPWLVVADLIMRPIAPPPEQLFGTDRLLVLVEGLDYDYSAKDEEFSTQSRSDVIMAIDLDFRDDNVYELSVPRDMDAILPNGEEAKINQAQSDGGVHEAEGVISKWLGIPGFDRYVLLRIDTTKDLINAIGGIDIDPKNSLALMHEGPNGPINYDDSWGHLHIHFKPGMQHMNGDEAVSYARFRHDFCGDPCRIMRQQQVMHAVLTKIKGDKLNTLLHLRDLIGVFDRDVSTNFSREEELSLALAFSDMPKNGMHTKQVPYVDDKILADGGDVIIPDEAAKARLVQSMLLDPPLPLPSPDAGALAAIAPGSLRVDVENGSGVSGMAKRVASLLQAKGFVITSIGNADRSDIASTKLQEHSRIALAAFRVRSALPEPANTAQVTESIASASPSASPASDVTVIVGQDLASRLEQQVSAAP